MQLCMSSKFVHRALTPFKPLAPVQIAEAVASAHEAPSMAEESELGTPILCIKEAVYFGVPCKP